MHVFVYQQIDHLTKHCPPFRDSIQAWCLKKQKPKLFESWNRHTRDINQVQGKLLGEHSDHSLMLSPLR